MTPADEYVSWAQASLTADDGSGELGRPVSAASWLVPKSVRMRGQDVIEWDLGLDDARRRSWEQLEAAGRAARGDQRLLSDAVDVSRKPLAAVRLCGFVERWGVPELCQHGLLPFHTNPRPRPALVGAGCAMLVVDGRPVISTHALVGWSLRLRSVLNAGARLRSGREVDKVDADRLGFDAWRQRPEHARTVTQRVAADRYRLQIVVDKMVAESGARAMFRWEPGDERGRVEMAVGGPLGAAILQAALALSQADGFAVCAGCGQPFIPKRMPRATERSWCTACGKKAARREASRRYRERRKEKGADSAT